MKVSFGDIGTKSEQLICFRKGTQHKGNMVTIPMSLKLRSSHTLEEVVKEKSGTHHIYSTSRKAVTLDRKNRFWSVVEKSSKMG